MTSCWNCSWRVAGLVDFFLFFFGCWYTTPHTPYRTVTTPQSSLYLIRPLVPQQEKQTKLGSHHVPNNETTQTKQTNETTRPSVRLSDTRTGRIWIHKQTKRSAAKTADDEMCKKERNENHKHTKRETRKMQLCGAIVDSVRFGRPVGRSGSRSHC